MKVVKSEKILPVDVDSTLIEHYASEDYDIEITCPHIQDVGTYKINKNNVRLLKEKAGRGYKIIVWSQGGYEWAEAVVKALELEQYVDFVMTKPNCYIDDLPCEAWMGSRIWLDPKIQYKSS